MPSLTIVPSVTATSTASAPQAPPIVEMATPWSSVHVDGSATFASGWIGKTQVAAAAAAARCAACAAAIALSVAGPTTPDGKSAWLRWSDLTAAVVWSSKTPVTVIVMPSPASACWSARTRAPLAPGRRPRGCDGGVVVVVGVLVVDGVVVLGAVVFGRVPRGRAA